MDVKRINSLHRQAMELASLAYLAKQRDELSEAQRLNREAYKLEREVAYELANTKIEPSRSVIHRSAASLAIDCGEIREAEKLIATALAGNPPDEIASELRELMMQVLPQLQGVVGD